MTSFSLSTWNLRRIPIWPGCQHKNEPKRRNNWTYLAVYDSRLAPQYNSSDAAADFHPSKWCPLCFGISHGWRNSPFFTNFHFYVRVLLLGKAEDFSWICAQAKDDILKKNTHYPLTPGFQINTRKLANCEWFLTICEWEKYPLANVCELGSSMSSKHLERTC